MLALMDQTREPFVADEAQAVVARRAADSLKAVAEAHESVKVFIDPSDGSGPKVIVPLPAPAVEIIHAVLEAMANRTPISLIPYDAELSTQQAADFLNVSRPHLVSSLMRVSCLIEELARIVAFYFRILLRMSVSAGASKSKH